MTLVNKSTVYHYSYFLCPVLFKFEICRRIKNGDFFLRNKVITIRQDTELCVRQTDQISFHVIVNFTENEVPVDLYDNM